MEKKKLNKKPFNEHTAWSRIRSSGLARERGDRKVEYCFGLGPLCASNRNDRHSDSYGCLYAQVSCTEVSVCACVCVLCFFINPLYYVVRENRTKKITRSQPWLPRWPGVTETFDLINNGKKSERNISLKHWYYFSIHIFYNRKLSRCVQHTT